MNWRFYHVPELIQRSHFLWVKWNVAVWMVLWLGMLGEQASQAIWLLLAFPSYRTDGGIWCYGKDLIIVDQQWWVWGGGLEIFEQKLWWAWGNQNHLIIIIILINCNWVVTWWQWLFYMYANMRYITRKFKSSELHEKHAVATWKLGNHLSIWL